MRDCFVLQSVNKIAGVAAGPQAIPSTLTVASHVLRRRAGAETLVADARVWGQAPGAGGGESLGAPMTHKLENLGEWVIPARKEKNTKGVDSAPAYARCQQRIAACASARRLPPRARLPVPSSAVAVCRLSRNGYGPVAPRARPVGITPTDFALESS